MSLTTGPSILISLVIFTIIGLSTESSGAATGVARTQELIDQKFNIHPILFVVPAVVIFMIIKKVPALPALIFGTFLGAVFALILQKEVILDVANASEWSGMAVYKGIMTSVFTRVEIVTGNPALDKLLVSKGMEGMLSTIWLILCAMIYGGVLEITGMLKPLANSIIKLAHSTGSLVASTAGTCLVFNATASDQYIAIVVPGRMFKNEYEERNLAPENLSRTLEDSGTVTSVLIPWNTCAAYQSGVLGVSAMAYLPYCFFNIISPFMTIFYAYANIKIKKITGTGKNG
jgi:NhaC family Na+:H+ antiporter